MKLLLLFRTARHLRLTQVAFQIWYRVRRQPKISRSSQVNVKEPRPWQGEKYAPQSFFPLNKFEFLNSRFTLQNPRDWNNSILEKLWLYNLHYFDDLNATNSDERIAHHRDLILQWIKENSVMQGNGWEPYPLSLRIVNWIKWCWRHPEYVDDAILHSLHDQVRALEKQLEFHILANHLFANIKALAFAGQFFDGSDARRWQERSDRLLTQQLNEQFLSDGAHYERSPMYHCILLWDLLDLYCLYRQRTKESASINQQLKICIEKGLGWLKNIVHPDGEISFFNDTTFEIAPNVAQIQLYAHKLGLQSCDVELGESNFVRRKSNSFKLVADVGGIGPSYQPGHAHAEAGSFELSVGEQRVFVNSGINEYGISSSRLAQRSTAAHNAVEAVWNNSAVNSSEVWSGFRVARRAKVTNRITKDSIICRIHGFWWKRKTAIHTREFQFGLDSQRKLIIKDELHGAETGLAHFHLHPDCQATLINDKSIAIKLASSVVQITFSGHAENVTIESYDWHPGFGKKKESQKIVVQFKDKLVTTIS